MASFGDEIFKMLARELIESTKDDTERPQLNDKFKNKEPKNKLILEDLRPKEDILIRLLYHPKVIIVEFNKRSRDDVIEVGNTLADEGIYLGLGPNILQINTERWDREALSERIALHLESLGHTVTRFYWDETKQKELEIFSFILC